MTSGPYQVMPDLSAEELLALRQSIAERGVLVAVVKDEFGATIDGHHREVIAADLGVDCPEVTRYGLTAAEKRALAYDLNSHRRNLTFEARRSMVTRSLMGDPTLSDRQHAARLHVDHKTVALARRTLIRTGRLAENQTLVGKDGKERPAGSTEEPAKRTGEAPQLPPPGVDPETGEIIEGQEAASPAAPTPSGDEVQDAPSSATSTVAPDPGDSTPPVSGAETSPEPDLLALALNARMALNKALKAMVAAEVAPLLDAEGRESWQRTVNAVADWVDAWSDALAANPLRSVQ